RSEPNRRPCDMGVVERLHVVRTQSFGTSGPTSGYRQDAYCPCFREVLVWLSSLGFADAVLGICLTGDVRHTTPLGDDALAALDFAADVEAPHLLVECLEIRGEHDECAVGRVVEGGDALEAREARI